MSNNPENISDTTYIITPYVRKVTDENLLANITTNNCIAKRRLTKFIENHFPNETTKRCCFLGVNCPIQYFEECSKRKVYERALVLQQKFNAKRLPNKAIQDLSSDYCPLTDFAKKINETVIVIQILK